MEERKDNLLKMPGAETGPNNSDGELQRRPGPTGVTSFRAWLVVCAIAILFVAYGFLAFFVIGDKGPPGWDFGSREDLPGASISSTYPYTEGPLVPEEQHISGKPSGMPEDLLRNENRSRGEKAAP